MTNSRIIKPGEDTPLGVIYVELSHEDGGGTYIEDVSSDPADAKPHWFRYVPAPVERKGFMPLKVDICKVFSGRYKCEVTMPGNVIRAAHGDTELSAYRLLVGHIEAQYPGVYELIPPGGFVGVRA